MKTRRSRIDENKKITLTLGQLRRLVRESSSLNEEYGVDYEDTLKWVQKKKPDMSPEEQERFAKNIIAKKTREKQNSQKLKSAQKYKTYKDVEKAVKDYMEEHWPEDWKHTHYKDALRELGFVDDGYDQYGACAFTNGIVRVTVWYDRGEGYWDMEKASGRSSTTDNFYNTSSEIHDEYGNYGRGSHTDDWNLGAL